MQKSSLLIPAVVVLDQAVKFWARQNNLSLENPGLLFGITLPASPAGGPGFFSEVVVGSALIVFLVLYHKYWGPQKTAGWSLIVGGAVSNLLDRLPDGRVTDFINLGVSTINLADVAIWIGIILLLIALCYRRSIPRR